MPIPFVICLQKIDEAKMVPIGLLNQFYVFFFYYHIILVVLVNTNYKRLPTLKSTPQFKLSGSGLNKRRIWHVQEPNVVSQTIYLFLF